MKKHGTILLVCLLVILLLHSVGCKGKKLELDPDVATSDEALFKLGEASARKDPERARLYFRQIIESFPRSFYAQRAKLAIADTYFKKGDEGNMIIASSEYREFISLYPFSPSAPYAQLQIAQTFFKKSLKAGRDQSKTIQALQEFKTVVSKYPLSEEANTAREQIKECEERLAGHTLSIAHYYYKVKSYRAAVSRLTEILTKYIEFSQMDKVYFFIGDAYFRQKKTEESIPYFTKLITDYPKSKLAERAQKRMEEIDAIEIKDSKK
jgi:outer membrane protein assembly factor BamD